MISTLLRKCTLFAHFLLTFCSLFANFLLTLLKNYYTASLSSMFFRAVSEKRHRGLIWPSPIGPTMLCVPVFEANSEGRSWSFVFACVLTFSRFIKA